MKVVSPEVEGSVDANEAHLFGDGRICFGRQGGLSSLKYAYAKSVTWGNGFTVYSRTGTFLL